MGFRELTASFGQSSAAASIASGLAAAFSNSSQIRVTASGPTINIASLQTGSAANYAYSLDSTYDSIDFSQPSFTASASTGNLVGGKDATSSPSTIYSYGLNYQTNDSVSTLADSVMGNWAYGYDSLNRLQTATSTLGAYSGVTMTWGYDRYGNFLSQSATGNSSVSIGQPAYTSSGGNNRLDSFNYDSSGNLSVDAVGNQFTYDAAGKLAAVQGAFGYVYNAEGHRVAKLNSNGSVAGSYVLGLGGEQITEVDGSGNWVHTNVFANGKLIATYDNEGGNQLLHFHLSDWLGTRRAQTDQAGDLEQQCSSLPFGDNLQCGLSINIPTEHHFTGNERDSETGLDYFGARYYGSKMGRWMSPDWSESPDTVPYAALESPQSLNLYTYVQNNPILDTDPDGHEKCADGSAADACVNGGPKDPVSTIDLRLLGLIAQRTITVAVQNAVQSTAEYLTAPRDPGCMAAAMATGAATGAVGGGLVGGIAGGAGGTLVAPGIGTVVGGGVAGAIEGTKDGAMAGAAVGGIYGFVACKGGSGSGGGGGPKFGSNKQQNKNARDARRAAERETGKKFTPALERKFHDAISKQGIDNYHELVEIAVHVLKGY